MVPSGLTQICKSLQTSLSVFYVIVNTGTQRESASFSFFHANFRRGTCKRVSIPRGSALYHRAGHKNIGREN